MTCVVRLRSNGLDPIFLLAPTSTEQRMKDVGRVASGYVYYVSLKGVTGAGHLDAAAVAQMVPRIKAHVALPVGVGLMSRGPMGVEGATITAGSFSVRISRSTSRSATSLLRL